MVQVALSILKPAGSVGVTVQLAIAPPELLKVMLPNLANATGADQIAIIGFAITDITFSNSGNAIASCTVAPTLPAGLSIESFNNAHFSVFRL
jgi:hypothetical protein